MMRNKRFSEDLKNKHDRRGKEIAVEIMRDLVKANLVAENVKEDEGKFTDGFWDQMYELPSGEKFKVEPEMKDEKWFGEDFSKDRPFKYDTVDIPYRKAKNQAKIHIVASTCGTLAFVVTRKAMDDCLSANGGQPKIKKTIYEPNGAPYFSTPVDKGFFVQKKSGRWRKWK